MDDTDFKTVKTALTIANTDIKLVVNGGASANKNSGGGTHRANGEYGVTFDATDTATVGEMTVSVVVAGALVVFDKFVVLEEVVYDALFAAAATGVAAAAALEASLQALITTTGAAGAGLTSVATQVWAAATRLLTAGTNIALAKGVGVTGFNDLDAAGVRTAVGLATASLDTQLGALATYIDTEVAAIKAKTDNLPGDPADASDVAAAFSSLASTLATFASKLAEHVKTVLVGLTTSGSTTTLIVLNATTGIDGAAPSSVNDFYNGSVIVFTSGALAGQRTSVTDYDGTTKTLTVVALTSAPASGVAFVMA